MEDLVPIWSLTNLHDKNPRNERVEVPNKKITDASKSIDLRNLEIKF